MNFEWTESMLNMNIYKGLLLESLTSTHTTKCLAGQEMCDR